MAKKKSRSEVGSPAGWNLGALLMLAHAFAYRITQAHIQTHLAYDKGLVPHCNRTRQQVDDVVDLLSDVRPVDEHVLLQAMGGRPWHLCELVAAALHPLMKIEVRAEAKKIPRGVGRHRSPFRCVDTGRGGYRALEDVTGVGVTVWTRILGPYYRRRDLSKVFLLLVEQCLVASGSKNRRRRARLVRQVRGLPPSDPYRKAVEVESGRGSGSRWCVLAAGILAPLNINGLKRALRGLRGTQLVLAADILPLLSTREFRIRKPRKGKSPVRCMSFMNFRMWQRSHVKQEEPWRVPPAGPRFFDKEPTLERTGGEPPPVPEDFDDSKAYYEGPINNKPG
jgi:hypothetical protein